MNDLSQYQDLYVETAKQYVQALNNSLLVLEKNPTDPGAIEEIFRSAHSLKSQSAAMQFDKTGFLCHVIEDIFYEIKNGRLQLEKPLADLLFASFDALSTSITTIEQTSQEINLDDNIAVLKQQTGLQTEGVGKSTRAEDSQDSETPVAVPENSTAESAAAQVPEPAVVHEPESTGAQVAVSPATTDSLVITTIPVDVGRLDEMLSLIENLLILQFELKNLSKTVQNEALTSYYEANKKILDSLQFEIMQARTVPLSLIFDHYPRTVRDVAGIEHKQVELQIEGGDLALDRKIVEKLDEPLTHLLRNAVSHGIESTGVVKIVAKREADAVIIDVMDDGKGINWEMISQKTNTVGADTKLLEKALFSGISTADQVTQISGRGVGLVAVKTMASELGGYVSVRNNEPKGTVFSLKLPLSLSIVKSVLVLVGSNTYALPTLAVERTIALSRVDVQKTAQQDVFILDDIEIPIISLSERFGLESAVPSESLVLVVVQLQHEKVALVVDRVLEATDFVVKSASRVLENTPFGGATILSNGEVALMIATEKLVT